MKIYTLTAVERWNSGGLNTCGTTTYFSSKEKLIAYLTHSAKSKARFFVDVQEGFDGFLKDNISENFLVKEVIPNDSLFPQFGGMEYYYLVHEHELDPSF